MNKKLLAAALVSLPVRTRHGGRPVRRLAAPERHHAGRLLRRRAGRRHEISAWRAAADEWRRAGHRHGRLDGEPGQAVAAQAPGRRQVRTQAAARQTRSPERHRAGPGRHGVCGRGGAHLPLRPARPGHHHRRDRRHLQDTAPAGPGPASADHHALQSRRRPVCQRGVQHRPLRRQGRQGAGRQQTVRHGRRQGSAGGDSRIQDGLAGWHRHQLEHPCAWLAQFDGAGVSSRHAAPCGRRKMRATRSRPPCRN